MRFQFSRSGLHTPSLAGAAAPQVRPVTEHHRAAIVNATYRKSALGLAASIVIGSGAAYAQQGPANPNAAKTLGTVDVIDFRSTQLDSIKYTRELKDIPRIITVLPADLLQEQNVTSLKDAMRNIPGISLQAGEGNPPGGDQLKIRGFNARDDINVNGVRDLGNYFRDPFYVEQLEVVKGPNSAFSGRGSAGGTINFVTKKPQTAEFNRVEASLGSDGHRRATLDMNRPVDDNSAFRLNLVTHASDIPGRDIANEKRYGLYGAYTWGFKEKTRVTADYLHVQQRDLPDAGLPFDRDPRSAHSRGTGRLPPGLNFSNFYGHVDDYKNVNVDQFGLTVEHRLTNGSMLKNQTRYSLVGNDSITSSPRIRDIPATSPNFEGAGVRGELKPRDQKDEGISNQTDLLFSLNTGGLQHDVVTGMEIGRFTYENRRRPDVKGPLTDLYNPAARSRPNAPYDGTVYAFETSEFALYALDTVKLAPKWELNAGLRWDRVRARASESGRQNLLVPGDNRSLERTDTSWSYSLGVVHKLTSSTSLYASAGNAFEISGNFDRNQIQLAGGATARVADAKTFNIEPEKTTAFELGAKWEVGSDLDVNAAVFRISKSNARFPGQSGGDNSILDSKLRIQGFEVLTVGRVTKAWRLYSGYTYLDSKVQASPSRPFSVGQEIGGTPRHSFNVFTTYDFTPQLSLGSGLQYVAKQTSGVQATATGTLNVAIPDYTVADLYATYKFTQRTQLRINLYNAFDRKYISQVAEGGGQGIPGNGRQLIATLRHDF
jgi:catecholate siderophore receptor